ncbi:MAG: hypothetical protein WAW37_13895 [Syntrophobacteraceae bacterium]
MSLDLDKMQKIVSSLYLISIARAYGDDGIKVFQDVLHAIRGIYTYHDPDAIRGQFILVKSLSDRLCCTSPEPEIFSHPEYLSQASRPTCSSDTILVQISHDGNLLLWKNPSADIAHISENAIVYSYHERQESFVIKGTSTPICNPSRVHTSVFSIPTFKDLSAALEHYKGRSVRASSCEIFGQAWLGGPKGKRLMFSVKPEKIMRKSLMQFLENVLRGAEVRPEQNVDESHPVDIKVTWMLTNRIALIEIKWLGKSLNEHGNITEYSESRARDGASQLAEYLDWNRSQAPTHQTFGYLVIVDGRRRGIGPSSTDVNNENGMWYKDKEITFDPEYHNTRGDFVKPIRMFAEPICAPS